MESKQYTRAEITEHNGAAASGAWIILKDAVYDVTDFLDEHPGGRELLYEYAGKDATAAFEDFGHSSEARRILKKYEIGVVAKLESVKGEKIVQSSLMEKDSTKRSSLKMRRRLLNFILGPCAST